MRQGSLFGRRRVPRMPEGYYSGDKPNPNLRAFVDAHVREHPYNPATDHYDVPAFTVPLTIDNRRDALNDLHIYWSKKPYAAIRQYIRHYTEPGDLVLDPFCGSGGTALAALMEGRKAIAIDRSPAATFITKNYCTPVDPEELRAAFEELKAKVGPEMEWLYETRCDRCKGKATTGYTVYSEVFQCPRCLERVPLADCVEVQGTTAAGKPKKIPVCPHCLRGGHQEVIGLRGKRFGSVPVRTSYICRNGCKPIRGRRQHDDPNSMKRDYFERFDKAKLLEIEAATIPHHYPTDSMMRVTDQERWGLLWRPYLSGISRVDQFFTKRNLWALAAVRSAIEHAGAEGDHLRFALSGAIYNASRMYREREGGGGPAEGVYYVPPVFREVSVWTLLYEKVDNLDRSAYVWSPTMNTVPVCISTQSATNLGNIPSDSSDYVFTDPPYSWKVQYGESNFLWEAWLGFDTSWHDEEIIVNEVRGKTRADWAAKMHQAMGECYRVLKPGRWLSLCYHDTSEGTWELIQDIMAEVGFVADWSEGAVYIETGQKAWKQVVADKINRRDLVINFRKPKADEIGRTVIAVPDPDAPTFREAARQVIRDYLTAHPGSTKDRVYDDLVSRMVRSGRMQAHNFEEILREVADEVKEPRMKDLFTPENPNLFGTHEVSRWYLKESDEVAVDEAESAKEAAAAKSIRSLMEARLKKEPALLGLHYSDLFEHYVYAVKDKPRRELADWLVDYFFKTEDGLWRPPATPEEEDLKARGRAAGVNRRIKRYVAMLESGSPIPANQMPSSATLVEWIRHARRNGMYEAGRLLFELGGLDLARLSDEARVEVEEDYEVCVRALRRRA